MNGEPSDIIWRKRGQSYNLLLNIICSRGEHIMVLRAFPIENPMKEYILGIYLKESNGKVFGNLESKFDLKKLLEKNYSELYHTINIYCSSTGSSERDLKDTLDKVLKYLSSSSIDMGLSIDLKGEEDRKIDSKKTSTISPYL